MQDKLDNRSKKNYYSSNSSRMMKEFNAVYNIARKALLAHFIHAEIDDLESASERVYINLFTTLPFIGGRRNSETINIIMGAIVVAIILPLTQEDLTERNIGKIIHDSFVGYFQSRPKMIRMFLGKFATSHYFINRMRKGIDENAKAEYEDNFQLENIDLAGAAFDFGYNYTKCALLKIFSDNGVEEYLKYVCLGDYTLFTSIGVGFTRTQTIAHGAPICDFRFKRKGKNIEAWPPEYLPEWKVK
ncbi:MAG: hypothetical protein HN368_13295 [Spirochaetales bacterium]|jgi:hypothetical protein|nr:hypothetical protein [Spirochaetales bacterium]